MITKIWYSIQNGGDGSAHSRFMESKELAELDQDHMDEGWGESCTGSITIEHEGPITIKNHITTIEDMIDEIQDDYTGPDAEYFPTEKYEALKKLKGTKDDTP